MHYFGQIQYPQIPRTAGPNRYILLIFRDKMCNFVEFDKNPNKKITEMLILLKQNVFPVRYKNI